MTVLALIATAQSDEPADRAAGAGSDRNAVASLEPIFDFTTVAMQEMHGYSGAGIADASVILILGKAGRARALRRVRCMREPSGGQALCDGQLSEAAQRSCWKANCSGMCGAPSPDASRITGARSGAAEGGPFFWMKSGICRWRSSPSCCDCCRSVNDGWEKM